MTIEALPKAVPAGRNCGCCGHRHRPNERACSTCDRCDGFVPTPTCPGCGNPATDHPPSLEQTPAPWWCRSCLQAKCTAARKEPQRQ